MHHSFMCVNGPHSALVSASWNGPISIFVRSNIDGTPIIKFSGGQFDVKDGNQSLGIPSDESFPAKVIPPGSDGGAQ
ncbi:hypothetical protein K438DRAFT_1846436 [Mycena galopus ATCC 62051]|nr:hypothetical protein K438DRAFT_1846436 [Mycena galopus ATCC 62051]